MEDDEALKHQELNVRWGQGGEKSESCATCLSHFSRRALTGGGLIGRVQSSPVPRCPFFSNSRARDRRPMNRKMLKILSIYLKPRLLPRCRNTRLTESGGQ